MASDRELWTKATLGELGEFRNGANFSQEDYAPGFPIVNVKQLYGGRHVGTRQLLEVNRDVISKPESLWLRYGDILFARSSVKASGAGQVAMVGPCPKNAIFSGFIIRFRVASHERVAPEFLNYLLRSPIYRELLTRIASGTTISNLSQVTLAGLTIELPPIADQKAIANILGVLDDKIELNRRMNETLEGLARAIFQSWFVDFDPVRAQRDGLPPPALSPTTAALFPDSFEDSELGKIPMGWKVASLEDIAVVGSGNRPNDRGKEQTADMTVPLYGGGGCMGFVPIPLFRKPILLTGRVGTLGIIFRVDGPSWPSDNTLVIEPKSDDFFDFTYFQLRSFDLVVLNRGSTQPLLTQTDLKQQSLVLPPAALLGAFQRQSAPLFGKVNANLKQSSRLAAIRDALLPKLLSGEIRVAEAERLVEDAG